jgi:hypothetical protein
MVLSRRQFVMKALPAAACNLAAPAATLRTLLNLGGLRAPSSAALPRCLLLEAGGRTLLQESLQGFEAAFAALGVSWERVSHRSFSSPPQFPALPEGAPPGSLIVAPGALLEPQSAAFLRRQVERGALLVFESAAAFAAPQEFRAQARLVQSAFGVAVRAACNLWPAPAPAAWTRAGEGAVRRALASQAAPRSPLASGDIPYVRYRWPVQATVRDFSRAVTFAGAGAIARVRGAPVAARKRVGRGTLIFLGSPLGPHLLARDPDAARWLAALIQSSARAA